MPAYLFIVKVPVEDKKTEPKKDSAKSEKTEGKEKSDDYKSVVNLDSVAKKLNEIANEDSPLKDDTNIGDKAASSKPEKKKECEKTKADSADLSQSGTEEKASSADESESDVKWDFGDEEKKESTDEDKPLLSQSGETQSVNVAETINDDKNIRKDIKLKDKAPKSVAAVTASENIDADTKPETAVGITKSESDGAVSAPKRADFAPANDDERIPVVDGKIPFLDCKPSEIGEERKNETDDKKEPGGNANGSATDKDANVQDESSKEEDKSFSKKDGDDKMVDIDNDDDQPCEMESFIEKEPLIDSVKSILEDFSVDNVNILNTENGKCWQIVFVDEGGEKCENILNKLASLQIGDLPNTTVSIFPASIYRGVVPQESDEEEEEEDDNDESEQLEGTFKKSIRARMLVTQVVNSVRENAEFTFDYVLLTILASMIAALGLAENSSVILVASMLVSPLMGPILAGTFGTVIKNFSLRALGFNSEIKGLLICICTGFMFGLVTAIVGLQGAIWGSVDVWPSDEMKARGVLRGLWVGILIAIPSGAGVALSVLGGNSGSLVGVAISASLLPPAVNAGMLWAYSILAAIFPPILHEIQKNVTQGNTSELITEWVYKDPLGCKAFENNNYSPVHSCNMAIETAILGVISLTLTLLNISCIIIMGILVLKIKEVAPQAATLDENRNFWHEDIKIVRDSYQTTKGKQSVSMAAQAKQIIQEWKNKKGDGPAKTLELKKILEEIENSPNPKGIPKGAARAFSQLLEDDFHQAELDLISSDTDLTPDINRMPYDVYKTLTASNSYRTIHHLHRRKPRQKAKRATSLEVISEDPPKKAPVTAESNSKASTGSKKIHFPALLSKITIGKPESSLAKRRKEKKEEEKEEKKTRFKVDKVDDRDVEMSLLDNTE